LKVPILKQGNLLIASIQSALSDDDLTELREELTRMVGEKRAKGVIIEVATLDVIDSFATRTLRSIAHMARLRGADTVIVGIRPEVAFSMVQLGLSLAGIHTALDLDDGMELLRKLRERPES